MIETEKFQQVEITSQSELREWLIQNHQQKESIWLVTYKKAIEEKYVSTSQVLDELLCFGWIDGIRRKLDENRTMQLIAPRKAQHWSGTYTARVAKLTKANKMHTSGLKSVELAKQNGLWSFMDDVDQLIKPEDLDAALKKESDAQLFFDHINDSSKRFVLRWLKLSKTIQTRQNRIHKIVELSKKGEKLPGS